MYKFSSHSLYPTVFGITPALNAKKKFLASFHFLDFMLVVYDKKGSKIMTNLKTQT